LCDITVVSEYHLYCVWVIGLNCEILHLKLDIICIVGIIAFNCAILHLSVIIIGIVHGLFFLIV